MAKHPDEPAFAYSTRALYIRASVSRLELGALLLVPVIHLYRAGVCVAPVDPNAERRRLLAIQAIDAKLAELKSAHQDFDPLSLSTLSTITSGSALSAPLRPNPNFLAPLPSASTVPASPAQPSSVAVSPGLKSP
jgi:hypothetical protein